MAVYIGNVAALSFLRFLQKTLKRHIGPSSFTDGQKNVSMLETEIQHDSSAPFEDSLTTTEKRDLIKCFMRVVSV